MAKRRILVVEDDKAIRQGIVDALAFDGYDVLEAKDGQEGTRMALRFDYDLLLLDLILPRGDGLEILQAVRAGRPTQPVIILTARGEEQDRIKGLELGADDYVVKPFSVKELLARILAVLRRSPERPAACSKRGSAGPSTPGRGSTRDIRPPRESRCTCSPASRCPRTQSPCRNRERWACRPCSTACTRPVSR